MSMLLFSGLAIAAGYIASKVFGDDSSKTQSPTTYTYTPSGPSVTQPAGAGRKTTSPKRSRSRAKTTSATTYASPASAAAPATGGGGWMAQCDMGGGSGGTAVFGDSDGPVTVYDAEGIPLQLGIEQEFASGGEGTVYSCPNKPKFVIKIYKRRILENTAKRDALERRLRDMLAIEPLRNTPDVAWPLMPVFDENKRVAGFVMRAVKGTSMRALQGSAQIKRLFLGWNRKDLALVAKDFLDKMQLLAGNGVLVNDFNPANFLVGKDHRVMLIDCDSYQIPSRDGGEPHVATSYFASHVAPELLRNPEGLNRPRGPEQARFGAAIIAFQLLMCGLHPYSHKNGGTPEGNLKAGKCPLGLKSGCMLPSGWYNLISYLPFTMMETFIRMFRDGHGNPAARPTLAELRKQVEKFLFVMEKDPVRRDLAPKSPKPKSDSSNWSEKNNAA